jgi:hypothetical protein
MTIARARQRKREEAYRERHREEIRTRHRDWRRARPEYRKWEHLRRYGITQEFYEELLAEQGGRCEICGTTDPGERRTLFCVDHDHETGKIRGLLCARCNKGLGAFGDDPARVAAAASYLGRHKR